MLTVVSIPRPRPSLFLSAWQDGDFPETHEILKSIAEAHQESVVFNPVWIEDLNETVGRNRPESASASFQRKFLFAIQVTLPMSSPSRRLWWRPWRIVLSL
jgi:hypothetical protein